MGPNIKGGFQTISVQLHHHGLGRGGGHMAGNTIIGLYMLVHHCIGTDRFPFCMAAYAFTIKIIGIPPFFPMGVMAGAAIHSCRLFKTFTTGKKAVLIAMNVQLLIWVTVVHIFGILVQVLPRKIRKRISFQDNASWS